jgi:hypothetical protein
MPVTIGNLTSNVNVTNGNSMLSEAMLQQIVNLVMARLREEQYTEDQLHREREIGDRMSENDAF